MKVAFLISGQPRRVKETYNNISSNFLNPYNPDVFIHSWVDQDCFSKNNTSSFNLGDFTYSKDIVGEIYNYYTPKKALFEDQIKFILPDNLKGLPNSPNYHHNMTSMLYSMNKVNELKKQYEEENNFVYDCVIRYRFDLKFYPPDEEHIDLYNYDLDKGVYCISDCPHYNGVNDQFALGNSENMDAFNSSYNNLKEFSKNYKQFAELVCGETIVYYSTWIKNNILVDYLPYKHKLLR